MTFAFVEGEADEGWHTLRITFQETNTAVEMKLEGRLAGPWANELDRVWRETAPKILSRKLIVDLQNVTYADLAGKRVLQKIYAQTNAAFVAVSPSSQFLAEEITLTTPVSEEGN
jgi:anti-anti-sigma regulatory factor